MNNREETINLVTKKLNNEEIIPLSNWFSQLVSSNDYTSFDFEFVIWVKKDGVWTVIEKQ
jgi:hypothetical protein